MTTYFIQTFIYLASAVVVVPIAKRLGLGSVSGYLIAGIIIGPVTGLVGNETSTLQHYAEFGVVMMLFLVGIELEPKMLWSMRHKLIGLGGLQVILTTAAIMGIALFFNVMWQVALTIGLIFSLSSTAIVLQTLSEKGLTQTQGGVNTFSVLLFQDVAVIPMLGLIPLLSLPLLIEKAKSGIQTASVSHEDLSLVAHLNDWAYAGAILAVIALVVVGGHFLSRPLFQFVAKSSLRDIFTATALMIVIGVAALMSLIGLSPALGTFLAGVVLANSEFKHELESNIEPFKGLLMGLFFITVGASIHFGLLFENIYWVLGLTLGVIVLKAVILWVLSWVFNIQGRDRWLLALSLAQTGEFGFVLLNYSTQHYVIPTQIASLLSLVVALSMCLTPLLFILFDKVISPLYKPSRHAKTPDAIDEKGTVIIAGIGRFGQIVNRFLMANGFETVAIDHRPQQVELMRTINIKSFYGDATRLELLHTAGMSDTRLFVVAIDGKEDAVTLVKEVKKAYPHVSIFVRAFDRRHYFSLLSAGADFVVSETYLSALELGQEALKNLGIHPFRALQQKAIFIEAELSYQERLYQVWLNNSDEKKMFNSDYRELFLQLEAVIEESMQKVRYKEEVTQGGAWQASAEHRTDNVD